MIRSPRQLCGRTGARTRDPWITDYKSTALSTALQGPVIYPIPILSRLQMDS